ncbi:MAG: Re/Si-specific NAD(P)(+) transhydrogenase subunit alpha [Coriobacteriia bacterium]|nr:Re/Si-specific NAD(P)(+) transhydrogenase subunit alpha [Coriobacteriia bacterium]
MILGVAKESYPDERCVALVPSSVPPLVAAGLEVIVESGAGERAGHTDDEFVAKGARLASRAEVFETSDVLVQYRGPGVNLLYGDDDLKLTHPGQVLIGMQNPLGNPECVRDMAERGLSVFALELVPRITRAQSMDVLSSMATVAGYQAVIEAAAHLPKLFPLMMTAAGTLKPARVFVVGVGVAGLQAIATAKRLGAVVEAYDVRPAVRDQVTSVGARFVEFDLDTEGAEGAGGYAQEQDDEFIRRQQAQMKEVVVRNDVVITTAAIPGKKAPVLVTADMVAGMAPGSVIIDLAAQHGGNCELSDPGEGLVQAHGVTIVCTADIVSRKPYHASQMFSKNVETFLISLMSEGRIAVDPDDEVATGTVVCQDGHVVHPRVLELLGQPPVTEPERGTA